MEVQEERPAPEIAQSYLFGRLRLLYENSVEIETGYDQQERIAVQRSGSFRCLAGLLAERPVYQLPYADRQAHRGISDPAGIVENGETPIRSKASATSYGLFHLLLLYGSRLPRNVGLDERAYSQRVRRQRLDIYDPQENPARYCRATTAKGERDFREIQV